MRKNNEHRGVAIDLSLSGASVIGQEIMNTLQPNSTPTLQIIQVKKQLYCVKFYLQISN